MLLDRLNRSKTRIEVLNNTCNCSAQERLFKARQITSKEGWGSWGSWRRTALMQWLEASFLKRKKQKNTQRVRHFDGTETDTAEWLTCFETRKREKQYVQDGSLCVYAEVCSRTATLSTPAQESSLLSPHPLHPIRYRCHQLSKLVGANLLKLQHNSPPFITS